MFQTGSIAPKFRHVDVGIGGTVLVPQIIAPYFDLPAPDMSRYDFIRGDARAAVAMALLLPLTAAVPEEIVYRGFMMQQFTRLFGVGQTGAILAVLSQALVSVPCTSSGARAAC